MTSIDVLFLLCCCCCYYSTNSIAIDAITSSTFLQHSDSIVSNNGDFKLGFFSPSKGAKMYVGIWFNKVPTKDVFWVANRNSPLNDNSGVMKISADDGNLQVLNSKDDVLWSSNVSVALPINNATLLSARLLDSGNLVLLSHNSSTTTSTADGTILWKSFEHPTDCLMPNTKLTITSSNMKHSLQPWKSPSDPSYGRFSVGADSFTHSQVMIWDNDRPHWRSGPWNGNGFIGMYSDENQSYANTYILLEI